MTARDRRLLAVVAALVALAAFWFVALAPKRHEASAVADEVAAQRATLTATRSQVALGQAAKAGLGDNLRTLARVTRAVPTDAGVPDLLRQLERTSHRTKVVMTSIATAKDAAAAPAAPAAATPGATGAASTTVAAPVTPTPLGLTLTFDGSFFRLQKFFGRLDDFIRVSKKQVESHGRLMAISGLSLAVGEKGFPDLTAKVSAQVYTLPALPGAPTAPGAGPTAPPATATAATPATQPASTTTPATPGSSG